MQAVLSNVGQEESQLQHFVWNQDAKKSAVKDFVE